MIIPEKKFMNMAIELAKQSALEGDYAIGAVIVKDGEVIGTGKTLLKHEPDPTVHAEVVAIRVACKKFNSVKLKDCVLYTTHEPCPMCASAAIWARMKGIVFGATIEDAKQRFHDGTKFTWRQIDIPCKFILDKGDPKLELVEEFMREECKALFDLSR